MKTIFFAVGALLLATSQSLSQSTSIYPSATVHKEEFLLYLSIALVAKEGCENYEVNSQYVNGYIDASGIEPKSDPLLLVLLEQSRTDIAKDKTNYCRNARSLSLPRPLDQRAVPLSQY